MFLLFERKKILIPWRVGGDFPMYMSLYPHPACIFRKLSVHKCIVCQPKMMDGDYSSTQDFKVINYNFCLKRNK